MLLRKSISSVLLTIYIFGINFLTQITIQANVLDTRLISQKIKISDTSYHHVPQLLFRSGFEGTTSIIRASAQVDRIRGADSQFDSFTSWDNELKKTFPGFAFTYEGGDTTMRYARIVKDPENKNNKVLKFWLAGANVTASKKARIQASATRALGLKNIYQTVKFRLSSSFDTLRNWNKEITWLTLFEFWNNGASVNNIDPFRIKVDVVKPNIGIGEPLYFCITAQTYDRKNNTFSTIWTQTNQMFALQTNKWMKCEIYFQEGDNKSGRFYLAVTPEGEGKSTVIDMQNFTQAPGARKPDGLQEYNPFKLYTSKALIDYLASKGVALEVFWDDFELWTNKLPE